jgi:hypothetical protein
MTILQSSFEPYSIHVGYSKVPLLKYRIYTQREQNNRDFRNLGRSREVIWIIIGRNGVDISSQIVRSLLLEDLHKYYVIFPRKNLIIKYSGVESSESIILCELPDTPSAISRKHGMNRQKSVFYLNSQIVKRLTELCLQLKVEFIKIIEYRLFFLIGGKY